MSERTASDQATAAAADSGAAVPEERAAAADVSSVPVFLSAREAATTLGVSERTIRRAIQKGEIHAFKHAGAFQITPAALETYRRYETGQATLSRAATPDRTAAAPDDDMPQQQTTESGQGAADAVTVLRELLAEERRKSDALLEASLVWQTRAMQLQERLAALEAGELPQDDLRHLPDTEHAAQDANAGPLRDEIGDRASESLDESSWPPKAASDTLALRWRRWWRRVLSG